MITTVPERLAIRMQGSLGLVLREVPLALPPIGIDLIWHERRHHDPMLAWVRRTIESAQRTLNSVGVG
jgi:DNA-binding transcriptional LysR family regulator